MFQNKRKWRYLWQLQVAKLEISAAKEIIDIITLDEENTSKPKLLETKKIIKQTTYVKA